MKNTVVVSKEEYRKLRLQSKAYQKLAGQLFHLALTGSVEDLVEDFRKTKLYSEAFLNDLGEGLKKSSYVRK